MRTRQDEATGNLAWRLVARQHPKAVYETVAHADTGIVNSATKRLPEGLKQEFPDIRIRIDRASDHPEKFRSGNELCPIKRSGNWESLASLSRALAGLGEISQFRVYADVRHDETLEREIEDFCRKEMA